MASTPNHRQLAIARPQHVVKQAAQEQELNGMRTPQAVPGRPPPSPRTSTTGPQAVSPHTLMKAAAMTCATMHSNPRIV